MIEFKLQGLEEALARMRDLTPQLRAKGARYAGRKGADVIAAAVRARARQIDDPLTAESIEKNITARFSSRRYKQTGDVMFRVGVLGGAKPYGDTRENRRKQRVGKTYKTGGDKANPGGDTWHWRLVEFGTERTRAQPFMRPAMDESVNPATDTFVRELSGWLDRWARKQARAAR